MEGGTVRNTTEESGRIGEKSYKSKQQCQPETSSDWWTQPVSRKIETKGKLQPDLDFDKTKIELDMIKVNCAIMVMGVLSLHNEMETIIIILETHYLAQ